MFLSLNYCRSLILAMSDQKSLTIQLSKPFTYGHPVVLMVVFSCMDDMLPPPCSLLMPQLSLSSLSLHRGPLYQRCCFGLTRPPRPPACPPHARLRVWTWRALAPSPPPMPMTTASRPPLAWYSRSTAASAFSGSPVPPSATHRDSVAPQTAIGGRSKPT